MKFSTKNLIYQFWIFRIIWVYFKNKLMIVALLFLHLQKQIAKRILSSTCPFTSTMNLHMCAQCDRVYL